MTPPSEATEQAAPEQGRTGAAPQDRDAVETAQVELLVRAALDEDLAGGLDLTSSATIAHEEHAWGDVVARGDGVVAGLDVAAATLLLATHGEVDLVQHVTDGARVARDDVVLSVYGRTQALLTAERTVLNFLCHLSGVATATRRWVDAVEGTGVRVRDTRKTTPLLRELEKYAVRCGGGVNHRMSLSDEALVKDNHIVAAGGVARAFNRVRGRFPSVAVQVEVGDLGQLEEALAVGAESILLDNMDVEQMREAVRVTGGRAVLEASGGLTLDRARDVAQTGVDFLAVGALTHSAPVLDLAFDLRNRTVTQGWGTQGAAR